MVQPALAANTSRRHDIDALRALAFACLILYHTGMVYVAGWPWHVKSAYLSEALRWPMLFMNRWHMDLVFLISGVSSAWMWRAKTRQAGGGTAFVRARSLRLLIPLLFGMAVVVPVQAFCQGVRNGLVDPDFTMFVMRYFSGYRWPPGAFDGARPGITWNHLWYLPYLWCYTTLLVLLQPALTSGIGRAARIWFTGLRGARLLCWPVVPLLLWSALLQRNYPETHDLVRDWYLHAVYASIFLYGWWLGSDDKIWRELADLRKYSLGLALAAFAIYAVLHASLEQPSAVIAGQDAIAPSLGPAIEFLGAWLLRNFYTWFSLCAILGWGHVVLNRPARWVDWSRQAVYPWYILHQSFIVLLVYWLVPLALGPVIEPAVVICAMVFLCWFCTAKLIVRVPWLRVCFGLPARQYETTRYAARASTGAA